MLSRREFLISTACLGPTVHAGLTISNAAPFDRTEDLIRTAPKARFWTSTASRDGNCLLCHDPGEKIQTNPHPGRPVLVKCLLCAQSCVLKNGERGKCRARINVNGELRSLVYGRPVAIHVDPIEKKPFYHFLPGSNAFSFATAGCPLRCKFCQNWEISQSRPEEFDQVFVPPAKIVD